MPTHDIATDKQSQAVREGQASESKKASGRSRRGFASMDPEKQRQIARKGGKAAHEKGTAHEFTRDEARIAGRKGGIAVSRNTSHMAEIGSKGGQHSRSKSEAMSASPF